MIQKTMSSVSLFSSFLLRQLKKIIFGNPTSIPSATRAGFLFIAVALIAVASFIDPYFIRDNTAGAADCSIFPDEASCTPNGCGWSQGTSCSGFDEGSCSSPCSPVYGGDCASFSDGGENGSSCTPSGCSYDSGSGVCSGSYFSACSGFYGTASCIGTYDAEAPTFDSAAISLSTLTLTYNEALDPASVPLTSDFTVTVAGSNADKTSVNVTGSSVVIELANPVVYGDAVMVAYSPGASPIQDSAGNDAGMLGNTNVTNVTPDSAIPVIQSSSVNGTTLTLAYNEALDEASVPSVADFTIYANGQVAPESSIAVTGSTVIITLSSPATFNKIVTVSYTPGASPIQDVGGNDAASLSLQSTTNEIASSCSLITVGNNPNSATVVGTKLYVTNSGSSNTVSVIDTITKTLSNTITVGTTPFASTLVGTKLYVSNSGSNNVSVIDTLTNTVTATIVTGARQPRSSTLVGTKLYVNNYGSSSVSVINTLTDTVTDTITVGSEPTYSILVGTKLYVMNFGSGANSVSVINTLTNTVSSTITVGTRPYSATLVGTKLYVNNNAGLASNSISVINTANDTVIDTITAGVSGGGVYFSYLVGTKLYALHNPDQKVYVIDTNTNSVLSTIDLNTYAWSATLVGTKLYIHSNTNEPSLSRITAIDTTLDEISSVNTNVGLAIATTVAVGTDLYIVNYTSNSVSVMDTTIDFAKNICAPQLTSITSSSANGTYTSGQSVNITANFNESLASGSKMRVTLKTNDVIDLTNVSGSTLTGTYSVGSGDATPDLTVSSISTDETYTSVSDASSTPNTETNYALPISPELSGNASYNLGDLKNIIIAGPYCSISVGTEPYQLATVGTTVYVANQGSDSVSVIDTTDNSVISTISVGDQPYGVAYNSTSQEVYVANLKGNTVSVINASSTSGSYNTVTHTISVGVEPYYVTSLGTNMYVTNNISNTVSVIATGSHSVTNTINVGIAPRGIKAHGTDLYVANFGSASYTGTVASGTVSVIASGSNTVTDTIIVGHGPRGVAVSGDYVYVANWHDDTVSAISTTSNTVTHTIAVGSGPRGILALGSNIYVENYKAGTMSIIATASNMVTATIDVGNTPAGMTAVGTDIYVSRFTDGLVSVLDTTNNTMRSTCEIDTTAPVISSVASSTSATTALITWTTDEAATSTLNFGLTTGYGTATSSQSATTSHTYTLTGLTPATLYHYQVASTDALGNRATSSDKTFTTAANLPTLTVQAATSVSTSTAILNATVTDDGYASSTVHGFEYGLTTSYGSILSTGGSFGTGAFSNTATGLTPGTLYHYRAYVTNSAGTASSSDGTFTTLALSVPTVTISSATSVGASSATLNGTITSDGNASSTARGFAYGLTTSYGATSTTSGTFGVGAYSASLTSLTCNTTYHMQAFAVNSQGTGTSSDSTFTTSACPDTTAPSISSISSGTPTTTGTTVTWTTDENATSTVAYGLTTSYGSVATSSGNTSHSTTLSGLTANTVYHYQITARDAVLNTATSSDSTFTTASESTPTPDPTPTPTPVGSTGGGGGYVSFYNTPTVVPLPVLTQPLGSNPPQLQTITLPKQTFTKPNGTPFTFNKNLTPYTTIASDARSLQIFLNSLGYKVSTTGAGSPGKETTRFGPATRAALARFQKSVGISPAVGYFGPITRAYVNDLIKKLLGK